MEASVKAGWCLWLIGTAPSNGDKLWITTSTKDVALAFRKAKTFCRRHAPWRHRIPVSASYEGVIDA